MSGALPKAGFELSYPLHFPVVPPNFVPDLKQLHEQVSIDLLDEIGARIQTIELMAHEASATESETLSSLFPHTRCTAQDATNVARKADGDFPLSLTLEKDVGAREGGKADHAEHDLYFRIVRVTGPEGPLFLKSVCRAKFLFHTEMAACYSGIARRRFSALTTGLSHILAHAAGIEMPPIDATSLPLPGMKEVHSGEPGDINPVRRWIIGHQIFAALTQGSIYALLIFEQAMRSEDLEAAEGALALARNLLLATSAAFRFTADFPSAAYRDVIRPSMGPPFVRDGFSGLLSADHCYLIHILARMRPQIKQAESLLPLAHAELTSSLRRVYDDHKLVCERFDGGEGPSLRGMTCSKLSGVELLERFKQSRLGMLQQTDPIDQ